MVVPNHQKTTSHRHRAPAASRKADEFEGSKQISSKRSEPRKCTAKSQPVTPNPRESNRSARKRLSAHGGQPDMKDAETRWEEPVGLVWRFVYCIVVQLLCFSFVCFILYTQRNTIRNLLKHE